MRLVSVTVTVMLTIGNATAETSQEENITSSSNVTMDVNDARNRTWILLGLLGRASGIVLNDRLGCYDHSEEQTLLQTAAKAAAFHGYIRADYDPFLYQLERTAYQDVFDTVRLGPAIKARHQYYLHLAQTLTFTQRLGLAVTLEQLRGMADDLKRLDVTGFMFRQCSVYDVVHVGAECILQ